MKAMKAIQETKTNHVVKTSTAKLHEALDLIKNAGFFAITIIMEDDHECVIHVRDNF